jgi:hypothetical protein
LPFSESFISLLQLDLQLLQVFILPVSVPQRQVYFHVVGISEEADNQCSPCECKEEQMKNMKESNKQQQ